MPVAEYHCGNCGLKNTFATDQVPKCKACGYGICYKARTQNIVVVQAR